MRRSIRSLLLLCGLMLLVPTAAMAGITQPPPPTVIDGDPLNIYVSADGGVQVAFDGAEASEWFPYSGPFDSVAGRGTPNDLANHGFGLILFEPFAQPGGSPSAVSFGKFIGDVPAPEAGPLVLSQDPNNHTVVTAWRLADGREQEVRITQIVTYQNGQRDFVLSYVVENISPGGQPVSFRANVAGDLAVRGTDEGVGFLTPGPPRFMGGVNQQVGAAGGFVENTPWSAYESNNLSTVRSHAGEFAVPGGFDNSISTESSDNAAGIQWDTHSPGNAPLGHGQSAVFQVVERFVDTLGLTPLSADKLTGEEHALTADVGDLAGGAVTNQTIVYEVTGANNTKGRVNTGADGKATFRYVGGAPGDDKVTAFVDSNGDGVRDENEPQAEATVRWTGPPAPVIGQDAGVRPVAGTVKIKLPNGTSNAKANQLGLAGGGSGFVKLTEARTIPIGSTLDTSRGTVKLLTVAKRNDQGEFQSGNFKGGRFRLGQTRKNPLTTLSMSGGGLNRCGTRVPSGGAAKPQVEAAARRRRRVFGNARGRFRTRGRNSSATVRGTQWSMTDTCRGTLTRVNRGSVVVRDFSLKKNRTIKAGRSYLAKPPKRRRRR